jgi:Asp-tRNA(Asn)/Glu-tRNA(Gln) amidotransferase A subunit family amidase
MELLQQNWQVYAAVGVASFIGAVGILIFGSSSKNQLRTDRKEVRDKILHKCLTQPVEIFDPNVDAQQLHTLYQNGTATCAQVTRYLCERSNTVGKVILGAVTEELYDEAFAAAIALDKSKMPKDRRKMPLWGIPISIKDCIAQKGTDATCGTLARCFRPFSEDGLQVDLLRRAGAILHVRSNVPQLLMMPESENNVWGRTNNPWDLTRTPGGSSGGEAALVASGCSVIGLGSDIGGMYICYAFICVSRNLQL